VEDDTLTVSIADGPANGTASVSSGNIVYTRHGLRGPRLLHLHAQRRNGGTDTGTVCVIVYESGQWPVLSSRQFRVRRTGRCMERRPTLGTPETTTMELKPHGLLR